MIDDREARHILMAVCEPGLVHIAKSIDRYGAPETLERLRAGNFHEVAAVATRAIQELDEKELASEWKQSGARLLIPSDLTWPIALNELPVPPIALSLLGKVEITELTSSIAIVGSRTATSYGIRVAEDFAAALSDRGFSIVSGGAFGIDAAAHRGALAARGITCAVLACGVSRSYPVAHSRLFAQIAESGLLISEVRPSALAFRSRFLVRNRLIAALSQGTIVVEAAMRSGSLRTAFDAAELHRHVMGIPGPITSPMSAGVHRLIAESVANLITHVDDVVALVSPFTRERVEHPLLALLSRRQGITTEELAHLGAVEVSQAFTALAELMALGCVVRDSRGAFLLAPA